MRGKAYPNENGYMKVKDHPRLCGEKRLLPVSSQLRTGSPPPMRGKAEASD